MDRLSTEELFARVEPHLKLVGKVILHKKTGHRYVVSSVHLKESTLEVEVTYRALPFKKNPGFSRPIEEIMDENRFAIGRHLDEEDDEE